MTIEGEDFFDPLLLAKDETCGIDEVKIFVLIFFVELPSLALEFVVDKNCADNLARQNLFANLNAFEFADALDDERDCFS